MQKALSILAMGLLISSCHGAVFSQTGRTKKKARCPDEAPTTGYYRNHSYDFSIRIPRGLKAFWNSARCVKEKDDCVCMGDHGRFIRISTNAYIEVFVSPQNYETRRESIEEEIIFRLQTHEEKKEKAETLIRAASRLEYTQATRLKLRYQDAKTGEVMIEDSIICAPPGRGFLYSVYLITPQAQYRKNKILLNRVSHSWRFRPWR